LIGADGLEAQLVEREYLDDRRPVGRSSASADGGTGNSVKASSGTYTDKDLLRVPADDLGSIAAEQRANQLVPGLVVDVVDVTLMAHDGALLPSCSSV
jgi:hypothetical protein